MTSPPVSIPWLSIVNDEVRLVIHAHHRFFAMTVARHEFRDGVRMTEKISRLRRIDRLAEFSLYEIVAVQNNWAAYAEVQLDFATRSD